ncbi:MAG: Nif11 family protein [Oscillospiraceae bacterium]|nr:Nif11 family protein [Oscillospiraceae bacterium]
MDKKTLLENALKDEAFAKKLFSLQEPEDAQALLKTKGVEFTIDEVKQIGELLNKAIKKQAENPGTELSLDELEEVAGGSLIGLGLVVAAGVIIGVCGATALGVGIASEIFKW